MSRPSKVFVSPHWVTVKVDPDLADRADVTGLCAEDKQEIIIDGDLGPTVERETLLHELLHQIWHMTEMDRKFKDSDEEAVVWSLAPRILALLRDNESLVEWLRS